MLIRLNAGSASVLSESDKSDLYRQSNAPAIASRDGRPVSRRLAYGESVVCKNVLTDKGLCRDTCASAER